MLAATAPQALRAVADRAFSLVAEGKVDLPITGDYEFGEAADAHRLLESRASTGKIVLRPNSARTAVGRAAEEAHERAAA
jgi:NADPH2:quinone reductase